MLRLRQLKTRFSGVFARNTLAFRPKKALVLLFLSLNIPIPRTRAPPALIGGAGGWLTASSTITDPSCLSHQRRPQAARPFKTAGGAERTHPSGRPPKGGDRESPPPWSGSGKKARGGGNRVGRGRRSVEEAQERRDSKPRTPTTEPTSRSERAERSERVTERKARGAIAPCEALADRRRSEQRGANSERTGGAGGAPHQAA